MRSAHLVVLISLLSACSSDDTAATRSPATDGGPGGAASGTGGAAGNAGTGGVSGASGGAGGRGTGGSLTDVPCGNAVCKPIADPSVESNACCTAETKCGYRLPIASACLGTNQFGTVTTACAGYSVQGKVQYPGCCSPTGCGARITTGGIGCVENTVLGLAHVDCVFDTTPGDSGSGGAADGG